MSHNVGAVELTQDVNLIRGNMVISGSCVDCSNLTQANTPYGYIYVNNNQDISGVIREFRFNFDNQTFNNGDYFTFDLYILSDQNNNSLDAWVKSLRTPTNGWDLVNVDFSQISSGSGKLTLTFRIYIGATYTGVQIASTSNSWLNLYYKEYIAYGIGTHWRPNNGVNYSQDLQNVVNAINSQPNYSQTLNNINNSINNLPSAQDNAEAMADEEEERTQDVVDQSQDTADSSQEDTDETGTSLLSVFTSVIGVIVNSQETSCIFDSHLPFMTGAGTIDLCMFNPPVVVQTIASLLALALFVPFGLHMYKRFISITRSFQK